MTAKFIYNAYCFVFECTCNHYNMVLSFDHFIYITPTLTFLNNGKCVSHCIMFHRIGELLSVNILHSIIEKFYSELFFSFYKYVEYT